MLTALLKKYTVPFLGDDSERAAHGGEAKILAAAHSGLTPDEMVIPLAVA